MTNRKLHALLPGALALLLAFAPSILTAADASFEIVKIDSRKLKNNPLHDPSVRSIEIFSPAQAVNGRPVPIVYFLPGYNCSSTNIIGNPKPWIECAQKIADEITPMILVVVDGDDRWGGSQYINSPAQGKYGDYICEEIVGAVEARHPAPKTGMRRIIAGHSSGGFGALRLAMERQKLFDGVIALSPDADFLVTQVPIAKDPSVTNVSLAEVKRIAQPDGPPPKSIELEYTMALCAAYAPRGIFHRGQFEWIYDVRGNLRPDVQQRWVDNDPLAIAMKRKARTFGANQSIYLDGAAQDECSANIGAGKLFEVLRQNPERCTFYEPAGHHSDHLNERLQRGLAWLFERPVFDIK